MRTDTTDATVRDSPEPSSPRSTPGAALVSAPVGLLGQLRRHSRRRLLGDVVAGITVAALVLPLSMGLAVTAGLPPETGLYASMLPMVAFALLATSRQTMIGPDASVTALIVASILPLSPGDPARHAALVATLALVAGACCVLAAAIGAGRLATVLRDSALTGYLAGLAVVVAIAQLPRMVGISASSAGRTTEQLMDVLRELSSWNGASVAIGAATLALVVVARARRPALPWMLVAVALAAVVSYGLDLTDRGVSIVGALPSGLPDLQLPSHSIDDVLRVLPVAVAVTLVTFADTLATAGAFAMRGGYRTRPGRDLAALGAADIAAAVSGGMPVSASGARTAAADSSGGTSQLTGLVAAATIALVLLGGGEALAQLPQPALGAVVVAAVLPMVDVQSLARMRALERDEFRIAVAVMAGVVLLGVLEGIVVAGIASIVQRARVRRRGTVG